MVFLVETSLWEQMALHMLEIMCHMAYKQRYYIKVERTIGGGTDTSNKHDIQEAHSAISHRYNPGADLSHATKNRAATRRPNVRSDDFSTQQVMGLSLKNY